MNAPSFHPPRRLTLIPLLTAAGSVVFIFEIFIPQPLPWTKLGLSNIAVLLALYYFGFIEALTVSCLRVFLGGLFTGSALTPAFAFGIAGGIGSVIAMTIFHKLFRDKFSPVGISVIGATAHSLGQLSIAYLFFIQHIFIWNLLPYMLLTSVFTGAIVGFIAMEVLGRTFNRAGGKR